MEINTTIGIICLIVAMVVTFFAGIQYGYKAVQTEKNNKETEDNEG